MPPASLVREKVVHPTSIGNPPAYLRIHGSRRALPRRSEDTAYGCYLPVLTGFVGS